MEKNKVLNTISIICIIIGCFAGYFILGPLSEFLKPSPEHTYCVTRPGEGFGYVSDFCISLGILLALIPFLGKYLSGSQVKLGVSLVLLSLAGFIGSVLFFLYMKIHYLRGASIMRQLGLDGSDLSLPPLYRIPLSGIVLMFLMFVVLKYVFKSKDFVNPV